MNDIFEIRINNNLVLYQKEGGLTFGTDAYLLYAYLKSSSKAVAADFGSGTGVISLLAASKSKFARIHAIEVQKDFCETIILNAEKNNLSDIISVHNKDVRELKTSDFGGEIDFVFTNPPYMKSDTGKSNVADIKNIARHEIMGSIDDFTKAAASILKFGGYFYAVYRPDRLIDLITSMKHNGIEPKRMTYVHHTAESKPSLVLIEGKKGASASLFVTKPLIIKKENGDDTDDITFIYENGEFNEQYKKS